MKVYRIKLRYYGRKVHYGVHKSNTFWYTYCGLSSIAVEKAGGKVTCQNCLRRYEKQKRGGK